MCCYGSVSGCVLLRLCEWVCCYGSDVSLQVISLSHMLRSDQPYWELYSSFIDIDPRVGTMSEFADVIKRADRLNVKVRYLDGCHSRHYRQNRQNSKSGAASSPTV